MTEERVKVTISKSLVKAQLDLGVEKDAIREEHYSQLNKSQWSKALKAMGLSNYRTRKVDFVIDDETTTPVV
jgi:hypothetical protein